MANPKLLWPLLESIIDPRKLVVAHHNRHILKNLNRKAKLCFTRREEEPEFSFKKLWKDIVKHVPVKASVHTGEDQITIESAS